MNASTSLRKFSLLILAIGVSFLSVSAFAATQDSWRTCWKCHELFYNGFPAKGRCPTGGAHAAKGDNFILTYGTPEQPKAQTAWRFCNKCYAMFYDGYPQKGVCPAGGGHFAQGFVFTLRHDVSPNALDQDGWRYCEKCHAMFDGNAKPARCAAGGPHKAAGWIFVLKHHGNLEGDVELHPVNE